MKKWIWFALVVVLLGPGWRTQWRSLDRMGERRFQATAKPATETLVGVCWPSSVNRDGMVDGMQLALDEINARNWDSGRTIRLVVRDDAYDWQSAKQIALEFADTPEMSAVIGYYDDAPAVNASAIFESSRLLHLIVGANNTAMTAHGFQRFDLLPSLVDERAPFELRAMRGAVATARSPTTWRLQESRHHGTSRNCGLRGGGMGHRHPRQEPALRILGLLLRVAASHPVCRAAPVPGH